MLELLLPDIQRFIREHEGYDPYQLTLSAAMNKEWPVKEIVQQIQARQKAKHKIPGWYSQPGILFPPPISIEQASSQVTARFKSSIFSGETGIDLTGGTGIDSYYIAKNFKTFHYIEKSEILIHLASHNFKQLKQNNVVFHHQSAEEFMKSFSGIADLIYLDPSRRVQGKVFRLQDSEPDVTQIMPLLLSKGKNILIKSSPLQDIREVINNFPQVNHIWVVAVQNDCKEVLYSLSEKPGEIEISCLNFLNDNETQTFSFQLAEEQSSIHYSLPLKYLYEPNVAILKAGAFKSVASRFSLPKLHPNSHLYTSEKLTSDFPGRIFKIEKTMAFNKKEGKQLPGQINVISRNFPASVQQIIKKLQIKEGGEHFLIATTLQNQQKRLLICSRLQ